MNEHLRQTAAPTQDRATRAYWDQLGQWRGYLASRPGVGADDVAELEDHLTSQVDDLCRRGLAPDEAFLVAVKRLGSQSALAADFAREHASSFWKQLVLDGSDPAQLPAGRLAFGSMLGFAAAAGLFLVGVGQVVQRLGERASVTVLMVGLLGLFAILAGYFVWQRRPTAVGGVAGAMGCAAVLVLASVTYPFGVAGREGEILGSASTQLVALIHVPIALLVLLGVAYLGDEWRLVRRWMDYLRFVGEWVIYLALIALGALVLLGLTVGLFLLIDLDPTLVVMEVVFPAGLGGALVVAAWLVEAKKSMVENMAPVLTTIFTPLFTLLLVVLFLAMLVVGDLSQADRELLIMVDLLLIVVWGLVLFATSARTDAARPQIFDWLQVTLLISALLVDVLVLFAMADRIGEFGASPNKVAALGENMVIAVNLAGALWLHVGFLRGRMAMESLRRWQCRYLPVIGVWAAVVVLLFPPLFGFA
ncbi:MAG: permease prefix domain 1-containing protein [Propioniciclava sp.]